MVLFELNINKKGNNEYLLSISLTQTALHKGSNAVRAHSASNMLTRTQPVSRFTHMMCDLRTATCEYILSRFRLQGVNRKKCGLEITLCLIQLKYETHFASLFCALSNIAKLYHLFALPM